MIGDHSDLGALVASLHVESNSALGKCRAYDRLERHVGVFSFGGTSGPNRRNHKAAFGIVRHPNACLKIAQTEFLTASAAPGPGAFNSVFAASFRPVRAGVLPAAKSSRFSNSSSPQKNVLFVGYGLDELEVLEYVIGKARLTGEPGHREMRHFLLQGFSSHEHEVA